MSATSPTRGATVSATRFVERLTPMRLKAAAILQATEDVPCEVQTRTGKLVRGYLLARDCSGKGFVHVRRADNGRTTRDGIGIVFTRIRLDPETAQRLDAIAARRA